MTTHGACFCVGPQGLEPECPCAMRERNRVTTKVLGLVSKLVEHRRARKKKTHKSLTAKSPPGMPDNCEGCFHTPPRRVPY